MKVLLKNITALFFLTLLLSSVSSSLFGQKTDKEVSHEDERMEIDAYALAYGKCKVESAKFQTDNNPTNAMLLNSYNKLLTDYKRFSVNLNAKYRTDEVLFEKFNRKVKNAEKKLPTCIAYQRMLDATSNNEKTKSQQ